MVTNLNRDEPSKLLRNRAELRSDRTVGLASRSENETMANQSKAQKETVERVMHEFKHGELETGTGAKVTNPKQAIAIALSEAGASNQQSPEENKAKLRKTKAREQKLGTGKQRGEGNGRSKQELYLEARERDVPGRSKMNKTELEQALGR